MTSEIRDFLLESLTEVEHSTDEVGEDTVLGPAEADEAEAFAGLTVGECCAVVAPRISTSAAT
ncbi:hypothetical protein AB0H12_20625 [Actinosynnema sp. NPDC023794]